MNKKEKARRKAERLFNIVAEQTNDIGVIEQLVEMLEDYILSLQEP